MRLAHGGHLSHGDPASITGRVYRFAHYSVRADDESIDLDEVRDLARSHRPRMIVAGGSSYPRAIDYAAFRAIADEVGARLWVDMAHIAGLVASGELPSPVPHADIVTCTTYKTLLGPHGGLILSIGELAKAVDRAIFPGTQGAPAMSQIAAKAVCFELASREPFRETQRRTRRLAAALARELAARGDRIVAGGTDTHMVLVDLRGPRRDRRHRRGRAGAHRHPHEPEPHPVRPGDPGPDQRAAHRHTGRGGARDGCTRGTGARGAHRRGAAARRR
jgi:glycine hydroxymethyltransferase